ncbi:hypothetical protein DRJ23_04715 [Candidatus Acetothermia bacterium]|nr:MFS transporter [Candidatus Bipolaricaulota bacterium]RLE38483.1 MAG: hypothetical protein DRJ23_04715 [Candidatus Acetothermia bacterium]
MGRSGSIWRNRNFILVWGGQSVSLFGSQLTYIALLWWVLEKTGSAAVLANVAIATALPSVFIGPIAGAVIDRIDRRRVMIGMNLANGLIIGTAATLLVLGRLELWEVYLFSLLRATATLFHQPALQASIPNLVPADQLTRANSLYQIAASSAGIAGPAIGGVLVGFCGSGATMWIDAATFLLAGVSLLFASFPSPHSALPAGIRPMIADIGEGIRFIFRRHTLLYIIFLFGVVNFFLAPMNVLLPVMAKDVLHAGAKGFGLLATAISVGMLVGGLLTASVKRVSRPGLGIIWGVVTIGGALLLFSLSRHMILSMGTLVIVGAAAALTNVLSVVIFQTHAPNEMQGRVFAADQAVSSSLEPIALATIGGLLTLFTAPLLILAGGVAVGIAGLSGYFIPGMRKL